MISNLKELQHVLKLCRKYGVTDLDLGPLKLKLGDLPKGQEEDSGDVQTDELTPEQLMFYSVGGAVPGA